MDSAKKSTPMKKADSPKKMTPAKSTVKELPLKLENQEKENSLIEFLKPENPKKSISERLSQLKEFQKLADKHERIEEKHEKMRLFQASSTGEDDVLTIQSASGENFNTGSEKMIKEILEIIVKNIDEARQKVQLEIEQFEI